MAIIVRGGSREGHKHFVVKRGGAQVEGRGSINLGGTPT
jgi:hypothetical protein